METLKRRVYGLTSFNIFLISAFLWTLSVTAQEVEDEREFDYIRGSKKGPLFWGDVKKEWESCKYGAMQSPIDLTNRRVKIFRNFGPLKRCYKSSTAIIKNRGHDITIKWVGNAGSLDINGTDYLLQQAHWHSPSEHSINGRRFDLELHLVHQSSNPNVKHPIAVIGIFYKIGLRPDPFLSKMSKNIEALSGQMKNEREVGEVDPREITIGGMDYYNYMGSLTVPPCTQGVLWYIYRKIETVSRKQVKLLRSAVHDFAEMNARPIQPINTRQIDLYLPKRTKIFN